MNLTVRRRTLLNDLGNVAYWADGGVRWWPFGAIPSVVTADMRKLKDAGLVEPDPDSQPKHGLHGYRITDAGRAALAAGGG